MNNGRLGLSIRRASERCNIARGTAQRAFAELQERGFIDCMTKGAFSRKALCYSHLEAEVGFLPGPPSCAPPISNLISLVLILPIGDLDDNPGRRSITND